MGDVPMVLYVMGAGRSGSTVLDIALNSDERIGGYGELINLTRSVWPNDEYGSDGIRCSQSPFWTSVRNEWARLCGGDCLTEYRALQCRFERIRSLPLVRWCHPGRNRDLTRYGLLTRNMYLALSHVGGTDIIVDSSKSPARAYAVSRSTGLQLVIIHLVRDVRGVIWSLSKSYAKDERDGVQNEIHGRGTLRASLDWAVTNSCADWVRRQLPRESTVVLRYEDVVCDSANSLAEVSTLIRRDLLPVAERIARREKIEVGQTVAGNRVRMSGSVQFRYDDEWTRRLSPRAQRLALCFTSGLMRRYGYKMQVRSANHSDLNDTANEDSRSTNMSRVA